MAFEDIKAEIALLIQEMLNKPEDVTEFETQLREKLNMLKAQGLPLPDDLKKLEEQLGRDFDV